jgi:hypothetical protein
MPGPTQPAHGKDTVLKIGAVDISPWCKTSTMEKNPDIHDFTGYGKLYKRKCGGQIEASLTVSGWFDKSVTDGPKPVLDDHVGETVAVIRQVLGAGTGKPSQTFNAVIGKYTGPNPCDDIVTWACDFAVDDTVTSAAQTTELAAEDAQQRERAGAAA